ncbi:MAG: error-prone DNA polymerase [Planctomycetota bacterium]|nr:error-prone DNA polymerase [Planctomycetota bacterium]
MRYTELHCKSNFSFLQGASSADQLVQRAVRLGYSGLAITDRNTLAGIVRGHGAAGDAQLPFIVAAELTLDDAAPCVVWIPTRSAYAKLCRLLTQGRRQSEKGSCHLSLADLIADGDEFLIGVIPDWNRLAMATGSDHHRVHSESSLMDYADLQRYREVFGERCYLLAELHRGSADQQRLEMLCQLSDQTGVELVAAGDVYYHDPSHARLQDILTATAHGCTVNDIGPFQFPNAQRHMRPLTDIRKLYEQIPDAIERTQQIAVQCQFSLSQLRYEYPEELAPAGMVPMDYLKQLAWLGAHDRYPTGIPRKVIGLLQHELQLIEELHYEAYFLTVWDLVRYARNRNILCQGRGSAANSVVCFCLKVTSVDPDTTEVLFERFMSRERDEAPDIDIDFEHERREEVLQYLYDKYGRDRAGMTGVVTTYRMRSAVRDVGKALGLAPDLIDAVAKNIDGRVSEKHLDERCREVGLDPDVLAGERFLELVEMLRGMPRHLSQHVGGMVITRGLLSELVPIENAAMDGRTVIQWNKDDLDELGILKVDCLSLGMLSAIHKCFDMLHQHLGQELTLATVPPDDGDVYDMICRADTVGVFQIESRAQMSMLPRLKPRCFYDLVIEIAIVRPGPIQGNMVHPYLKRRDGLETATYPNPAIRKVLDRTLGVPLFQEQAMRLAVVAAGFTPGEADQLRRAMGAWRRPGVIEMFHEKLIQGMLQRGLSREFAEQVFTQIRGFGEYGFPESHAASFALLVYVSAWLKYHYPAVFSAAVINSQPMGFYSVSDLITDVRRHSVTVLPVDVNYSDWDCTLEKERSLPSGGNRPFALRLGLRVIHGIRQSDALRLIANRALMKYRSIEDLRRRGQVTRALIIKLADADAFSSFERDRRTALWEALAQEHQAGPQPLFNLIDAHDDPPPELPPLRPAEQVEMDYRTAGLSLKGHPLMFWRNQLNEKSVVPARQLDTLQNNRYVRVAGIVTLRQRPATAKGITFVTLEDETGTINIVVRQHVWERYYNVGRRSNVWLVHGKLEKKNSVIHVVAHRLEDLSGALSEYEPRSRDFK